MTQPPNLQWEKIPNDGKELFRSPIMGGWLIMVTSSGSITFVPDPNHIWDLKMKYGKQAD